MGDGGGVRSALFRAARGLLLLTGIAVFALGAAIVFVPGAAGLLPVGALIAALGNDYFVVAAVGVVAVGFAVIVALGSAFAGVDEAAVPAVESVESAPHPGQAVDGSASGAAGFDSSGSERERLREAAVKTLLRTEHRSRSDAERTIADGSWTDDDVAADYLASDGGGLFRSGGRDDEGVRRAASAIARLDESQKSTGGHAESRADDGRRGPADESVDESAAAGSGSMINATRRSGSPGATVRGDEDAPRGSAGTGGP